MSPRRAGPGPVPELLVEKLRLGELDDARAAEVRAQLEAEGGLSRLEALDRSDAEVLAAHPPADVAREVAWRATTAAQREQAAAQVRARSRRTVLWAVPALAAAGLVVVAVSRDDSGAALQATATGEPDTTREKGLRPYLVLYREAGGRAEALKAGASAYEGDLLQIAYVSAGRPFGAIVSIDGRGGVTLHLPEHPGAAAKLAARGETTLTSSYELDDAPQFERFFLVTSASPFDTGALQNAARRLAAGPAGDRDPLALAPGLEQASLLVRKVRP